MFNLEFGFICYFPISDGKERALKEAMLAKFETFEIVAIVNL